MTRVTASTALRSLVTGVLGMLLLAVPAYGDPITLNFSGAIDLSSEGGPAVNTFEGSLTYDPDADPFEESPGFALYDPLSYTLVFNGVDVSAPVIGDGTGSGIAILDDSDPLETGVVADGLGFFLAFELPFVLPSTGDNDLALLGLVIGPTDMFSSTDLPASLDFLAQLTNSFTLAFFDEGGDISRFVDTEGPLEVSAPGVPEPATFALTALGLAAVFGRRSGRRRQAVPSTCPRAL